MYCQIALQSLTQQLYVVANGQYCAESFLVKNANIFIDVDLTLVDAQGKLLPGAKEALQRLHEQGCHLFLWSSVGVDYAQKIARLYHLTDLFEGYAAKPDIIIDDMPATAQAQYTYDVRPDMPWSAVVGEIIQKHLD